MAANVTSGLVAPTEEGTAKRGSHTDTVNTWSPPARDLGLGLEEMLKCPYRCPLWMPKLEMANIFDGVNSDQSIRSRST